MLTEMSVQIIRVRSVRGLMKVTSEYETSCELFSKFGAHSAALWTYNSSDQFTYKDYELFFRNTCKFLVSLNF
jgi:hypothetical protein